MSPRTHLFLFTLWIGGTLLSCSGSSSETTAAPNAQTPEFVQATNPTANAIDVALASNVNVSFTGSVDFSEIDAGAFTVFAGANQIPGAVSANASGATFVPQQPLSSGTIYTATVRANLRTNANNLTPQSYSWQFTTRDVIPPTVIATTPIPNLFLADGSVIRAVFSEALDPSTVNTTSFILTGPGGMVPGTVSYQNRVAALVPADALASATNYTVTLRGTIRDVAGVPMGADYTWGFLSRDTTSPQVVTTMPVPGGSNIDLNTTIRATFSEAVNPVTITGASFEVMDSFGTTIPGSLSVSGNTVTFSLDAATPPYSRLALGTSYTVHLSTGIQDLYNNPLPADYAWSFQTRNGWSGPEVLESSTDTAINSSSTFDSQRNSFHVAWVQSGLIKANTLGIYAPVPTAAAAVGGTGGNYGSFVPALAADDNGSVFAVWQETTGTPALASIYFNQALASGGWNFSNAIEIDQSSIESQGARMAFGTNGSKFVAWRSSLLTPADVMVREFTAAGWDIPQVIDDRDGAGTATPNAISPAITVCSDGTVCSSWTQIYSAAEGTQNMVFNFRLPSEGAWDRTRCMVLDEIPNIISNGILNTGICPMMEALPNGDVLVAWPQRLASPVNNANIYVRTVTRTGNAFSLGTLDCIDNDGASTTAQDASNCRIAVAPDGTAHAVFEQNMAGSGTAYSILHRTRLPNGTWVPINGTTDTDVFIDVDGAASGLAATTARIAVDSIGRVCVVWMQKTSTSSLNNLVARVKDSNGWGPIQFIDHDGSASGAEDVATPFLSVDSTGRKFLVTWQQRIAPESNQSIFANVLK